MRTYLTAGACASLSCMNGVLAQTAPSSQVVPKPAFEVASVKPAVGVQAISIKPRRSGNRVTFVTTLEMVLYYAYQVQAFQVSGDLPDGIYAIEATMDGSPAENDVRLMFQALLADRFRLRLHRETKVMRVYALVVAKKGPKLKAEDSSQLMLGGSPAPDGVSACLSSTGPRLMGKSGSMGQLADVVTRVLHVPVRDPDFSFLTSARVSLRPAD